MKDRHILQLMKDYVKERRRSSALISTLMILNIYGLVMSDHWLFTSGHAGSLTLMAASVIWGFCNWSKEQVQAEAASVISAFHDWTKKQAQDQPAEDPDVR